jgi:hypothetical protein
LRGCQTAQGTLSNIPYYINFHSIEDYPQKQLKGGKPPFVDILIFLERRNPLFQKCNISPFGG